MTCKNPIWWVWQYADLFKFNLSVNQLHWLTDPFFFPAVKKQIVMPAWREAAKIKQKIKPFKVFQGLE